MIQLDREAPLLITGAGGVLGRAILSYLKDEGFTNLLTPSREAMNLLEYDSTESYLDSHKPKYIIHLASVVFGLGGNLKFQMNSVLDNTAINNNLFLALQNHPVSDFFFAGTVASYPFPYRTLPLQEHEFFEGLPHYGEFGYAMAKRHAYSYLQILAKETGMRYSYGIFTNLYGEYDRFDQVNGHIIPSLITKAHSASEQGGLFEVWGDGLAERDFLHSADAARAVLMCLENDSNQLLINISSGKAVQIGHIAETIAKIAGIKEIKFASDKPVGIPCRVVDNTQLKQLGFTPSVSIEAGLLRTYQWYSSNLGIIRR